MSLVDYSPSALRDLDRVYDEVYEASSDFETADSYISDLVQKVGKKADFPQSGSPLYYENIFTGYYFVVLKAYMVFYRVREDGGIHVDRVLYGASDYMKVLFHHADG